MLTRRNAPIPHIKLLLATPINIEPTMDETPKSFLRGDSTTFDSFVASCLTCEALDLSDLTDVSGANR